MPGQTKWLIFLIGASAGANSACSSVNNVSSESVQPKWSANGYLSAEPTPEPEMIGFFVKKSDCEAAIDDWRSRQLVGNPVFAECLPIDRT